MSESQPSAGPGTETAGRLTNGQIAAFFDKLSATKFPFLHDVARTMRIDIEANGTSQHWHLTINHGHIEVARRSEPADAVMRTDPELFERILTGEANALTAALRGRLRIEGDARLLVAFKRLLPGPPDRATSVPAPGGGEAATRRTGQWASHGADQHGGGESHDAAKSPDAAKPPDQTESREATESGDAADPGATKEEAPHE